VGGARDGHDGPAGQLVEVRPFMTMVKLPANNEVRLSLVLGRDPRAHGDAVAGYIEIQPDATLGPEQEIAQDVGFEDGHTEREVRIDEIGSCSREGLVNPGIAAIVGHELNAVGGIALDARIGPGAHVVRQPARAELIPNLLWNSVIALDWCCWCC